MYRMIGFRMEFRNRVAIAICTVMDKYGHMMNFILKKVIPSSITFIGSTQKAKERKMTSNILMSL